MSKSDEMFGQSKQQQGPCPSEEAMIRYHQSVLLQEEMAVIKHHTNACQTCKALLVGLTDLRPAPLERMAANLGGNSNDPDSLFTERFRSVLQTQKPAQPSQEEKSTRDARNPALALFLKPALAYIIILALLYPAYLGLFGKTTAAVEAPKEPAVSEPTPSETYGMAQSFILPEARQASSEEEQTEDKTEFTLLDTSPFFILSFFVPVQDEQAFQYNISIFKEDSELVAEQSGIQSDGSAGNFVLVCNSQAFAYAYENHYLLVVYELNRATQEVQEEFKFPFKLLKSSDSPPTE